MIYTIGYERRSAANILRIARHIDATIIDVRGTPRSRRGEMNRRPLEQFMGPRYVWRGETLGNHGGHHVTKEGLAWLRERYAGAGENALLMCMEFAPGDCHRHHLIAVQLPDVVYHICDDELFSQEELQRALETGPECEYELCDRLPIAAMPSRGIAA